MTLLIRALFEAFKEEPFFKVVEYPYCFDVFYQNGYYTIGQNEDRIEITNRFGGLHYSTPIFNQDLLADITNFILCRSDLAAP